MRLSENIAKGFRGLLDAIITEWSTVAAIFFTFSLLSRREGRKYFYGLRSGL